MTAPNAESARTAADDEKVYQMFTAASIGDVFARPADTNDSRLWVVVFEGAHGAGIMEIIPDHGDWEWAALYEIPADVVPMVRPSGGASHV
ncbi:hypothetical protein [Glutamicibacter sp. V16R2B1]|uniref:hypothetical protein n=1 Tax=Glutamicibacter sp. V16R2B1 TaxID=2036207 RepID=UPI0010FE379E|nr:hypothetical protein [Glutamicibacter sp. V16R2B1]MCK9901336.1 hypothetical protein [Frankia sp. Cpl3]TLK47812.1 hypothetical protein FDN03_15630 [Glutamicibacter sp. V16R2B1]